MQLCTDVPALVAGPCSAVPTPGLCEGRGLSGVRQAGVGQRGTREDIGMSHQASERPPGLLRVLALQPWKLPPQLWGWESGVQVSMGRSLRGRVGEPAPGLPPLPAAAGVPVLLFLGLWTGHPSLLCPHGAPSPCGVCVQTSAFMGAQSYGVRATSSSVTSSSQTISHCEVLGARTPTYKFGRHSSAHGFKGL